MDGKNYHRWSNSKNGTNCGNVNSNKYFFEILGFLTMDEDGGSDR
jgi:hypothetical protein